LIEATSLPARDETLPVAVLAPAAVEKFSPSDLMTLRSDLLQNGVDSFQAAQIVADFLGGRGYGIGVEQARKVAAAIETAGTAADRIQTELESVAHVA
jgi:hypothetical protein